MTTTARPTPSGPATGPAKPSPDVPDEVRRLRATFATGRTRDPDWRTGQLRSLEGMIVEREAEITAAVEADLGRSAFETVLTNSTPVRVEAGYARRHLRRWMRPRRTPTPLAMQPGIGHYRHEPLGVVGIVGPWNYPINLTLSPLVGALAAGNCAVIKPSEHAPVTADLLARLLPEHLDADAVAVVMGGPGETQQLVAQGMDHLLFTGSPRVGALVMAAAAPHLTPVTLELGGKSPAIVAADADLGVAARRIALGKIVNSGQTCIAPDYVLVDRGVQRTLAERVRGSLAEFGAALPEASRKVVNAQHAARLGELLADHGGTVFYGGGVDLAVPSVEPTIVLDPDPGSRLMQEEIFGPVLPILGVADLDEAVRFVRSRPKPLAAYLFTSSRTDQRRLVADVPAGGIVVNHVMYHAVMPQLPFGGVGNSGMGAYHGRWGFETFSHRKAVLRKTVRPDLSIIYPPYTALKQEVLRRLF